MQAAMGQEAALEELPGLHLKRTPVLGPPRAADDLGGSDPYVRKCCPVAAKAMVVGTVVGTGRPYSGASTEPSN